MDAKNSRHPVPFQLPLTDGKFQRITTNGQIAADRLLVFLSYDVYEFIRAQSRDSDPQEVGGALLGQYCADNEKLFVIVPTAVPCDLASATPVSVDFPPEFWQQVEEIHSSDYPGLLRLGPYHSHPGYGVHPSSTDQMTILRAFSRPHHISVIYDPREDEIGYTCWRDGDLMPPSGCFLYEHLEPGALIEHLMEARLD